MVSMVNLISYYEAERLVSEAIGSGRAFNKMKEWIAAQGGDASYLDDTDLFPKAKVVYELKSDSAGYISKIDAEGIGVASSLLGAGRMKAGDPIDYSAGVEILAKTGDRVVRGETIAKLYTSDEALIAPAAEKYRAALSFSDECPEEEKLIYCTVE